MDFLFGPIQSVLQGIMVGLKVTEGVLIAWLIKGGWLYAIRGICFFLDTKLINFISYVYHYFIMILEKDMFNETLVDEITKNIYVFIGVIVFFRLMMLVVKYLINPDLVGDAKAGATALIQRCIIGMAGIIFIPTIFSLALRLQGAILEDQIIQKLIIPSDALQVVSDNIEKGGKFIGTYVLSGFLSPSSDASSETKREYATAINNGDMTSIDINRGGFLGFSKDYEYEYFAVASTFVLCYVFYQMLKYTIDLALRAFKMLLFQMMAPIAMVEYMINGSDDGVFKSWKKAVLSTYCMLFVRVMAIWFVVFITMLMSGNLPGYANGSLLAVDDNLLRAIIIIALLGFMMDLPKIVGQIFGLDLEQESSATGILKQVGGMVKGAAVGALAVGGAAVGGAIGVGKTALGALPVGPKDANGKRQTLGKIWSDAKQDMAEKHPNFNSITSSQHAAFRGVVGAALGANQFTGSAYKGYQGQEQEQQKASKEADDSEKANENKRKAKIRDDLEEKLEKSLKIDQQGPDGRVSDAHIQTSTGANTTIAIDPASIAGIAGAISGAMAIHTPPGSPIQQSGTATGSVNLDNLDVHVNGKATATYDGGLETNITGKATTTYNDGLDVQVAGQANAKYDQGIDVQVNGPANAIYDRGIDVQVNGPANATYDKGIDVQVNGPANAKYDQGIDVQVGGTVSAKYDGDVSTVVGGNSVTTVEGGTNTVVVGDTVTTVGGSTEVNLQDVDIKRNGNNRKSNDA